MPNPNKVKYGLSNCYYSVITYGDNNAVTFGTPVAMPGAVSISLSGTGDDATIFYADNIEYFKTYGTKGYEGDLELAEVPDTFKEDVLGETVTTEGVHTENANAPVVEFALLFQFEGDKKATRHIMYRCTASRPDVASTTIGETADPQTETITINASPLADGRIKARCYEDSTAYATWFTTVA